MKIWNHIQMGGKEYITVEIEPFKFENHGLEGGMYVRFFFDQGKTEARWVYYERNIETTGGLIGTWNRILTEEECLEFCENYG